eukprot:COSAG02_NODE_3032_length_7511_cov_4.219779_5_plen_134_part_00
MPLGKALGAMEVDVNTSSGFYEDGPCEDPDWIRCKHCCAFFDTARARSEHLKSDCPNKPPSLSGTKGWRIVRRNKAAEAMVAEEQPVVILDPPGPDARAGGTPVQGTAEGVVASQSSRTVVRTRTARKLVGAS